MAEQQSMPTCSTCRHWKERDSFTNLLSVEWRDGEEWDDFNQRETERNAGYGDCGAATFYEKVAESDPKPMLLVWDGSGYKAGMSTLGSFGCVLHEATPEP